MADPLHQDDDATREGKSLVRHLRSLGMTDAEIANDEAVPMTAEEMAEWFAGKRPSPFAPT